MTIPVNKTDAYRFSLLKYTENFLLHAGYSRKKQLVLLLPMRNDYGRTITI